MAFGTSVTGGAVPLRTPANLPKTGTPPPVARKTSRKSQPKFGRSSKRSMSTRY